MWGVRSPGGSGGWPGRTRICHVAEAHLITVGKISAAKRLLRMDTAWEARSPRTERESTVQPGRSGDKERAPTLPTSGHSKAIPPLVHVPGALLGLASPTLHPCTCTLGLFVCGAGGGGGGGSYSRLPLSKPDPYI